MKTIKIEKIYRKEMDGQYGPYTKVDIYSQGIKMSAFDTSGYTRNWQEGQTIEVELEQKGQYLNIVIPKGGVAQQVGKAMNDGRIDELFGMVKALQARMDRLEGNDIVFKKEEQPENLSRKSIDEALSDLPF